MSLRLVVFLIAVWIAGTTSPSAQEPRRQLGQHAHGIGTINVALDANTLTIDLEVSAMDVLGTEGEPKSPEQHAAAAAGEAILRDPTTIFTLPAAARCQVKEARVTRESDRGDDHADYRANYAFTCASPAALGTITVTFFEKFPRTESFFVRLATRRGQGRQAISNIAPRIVMGRVN